MKNTLKIIVFAFIIFAGQPILASKGLSGVINTDTYRFSQKLNKNTEINFQISKHIAIQLPPESMDAVDSYEGWQLEKISTHDTIAKINILVNGKPVFFPYSSILGVTYPDRFKIWEEGRQIYLQLSLGDGGYAYTLILKIAPSKRKPGFYAISERLLKNGEFPSEVWEKTQYHNDRWDSDL